MSDEETSPLLEPKGKGKATFPDTTDGMSESTPLLSGSSTSITRYDGDEDSPAADPIAPTRSERSSSRSSRSSRLSTRSVKNLSWQTFTAGIILIIVTAAIILLAFVVPAKVELYAKQAAVLEPTNLSLESLTANGVRARIHANFRLDATRVSDANTRRIGKAATWVLRKLETEQTQVDVHLPHFDNMLLGTATLPPLTIDIVDGHNTMIDIVADLVPGEAEGIRAIANQWLEGKLERVKLIGKADISLKTGFVPLGTHSVVESLVVEGQSLYRSFASLYFGEKVFF